MEKQQKRGHSQNTNEFEEFAENQGMDPDKR